MTFGDPQRKPSVGIRLPCIGAKQSVSLVGVTVSYCLMQMHTKDDQILEDRLQHERKKAKQITQVYYSLPPKDCAVCESLDLVILEMTVSMLVK